jgi:hypothetical protein
MTDSCAGSLEFRVAPGLWEYFDQSRDLFFPSLRRDPILIETSLADLIRRRQRFGSLFAHAVEAYAESLRRRGRVNGVRRAVRVLLSTLRAAVDHRAPSRADEISVRSFERQFERLATLGVFIARTEVLDRLHSKADKPEQNDSPIDVVAVPTADRPSTLDRCLRSYIDHAAHPQPDYLVVDDSSDDSAAAQLLRNARSVWTARGTSVAYVGRREKQAIISNLVRETGADRALIEFAVCGDRRLGFAAGGNRNAILLHTAGRRVLTVDDDTVCKPSVAKAMEKADGVVVDSSFNPRWVRTFVDRSAAFASVSSEEVDVVKAHADILGRSVGRCLLSRSSEAGTFDGANELALTDLCHGRGRVLWSTNGVVGHSGAHIPSRVFEALPQGERRIRRSERWFAAAVESQAVTAQVRRTTLSNGAYCSTMFLGLENTVTLPPFMPVLRGEDVLFGRVLRRCRKEAYSADLPFVLPHDPPSRRPIPLQELLVHGGVEFCYLLGDLLDRVELGVDVTPTKRMRWLGRHLVELGTIAEAEFSEVCRLAFLRRVTAHMQRAEQGLVSSGRHGPRFWIEAVHDHLDVLQATLSEEHSWVPFDLLAGRSPQAAVGLMRGLVRRFGELLILWPTIWEAARRLDLPQFVGSEQGGRCY